MLAFGVDLVHTQTKRVSGRVEEDSEGRAGLVIMFGSPEFEDLGLGGVEIIDHDIEVHLLRGTLTWPLRRREFLHLLEAQTLTVVRADLSPIG